MANRRTALLIATDSYSDAEFTDLRTPCRDAVALAGLLEDPQVGAFTVRTLANRPAQEVRQVLDETFTDADRDDLVLLHISGHGLKDESGRLHLIMSDTSRRHLRATAIAASWVRELIDHTAARRVVVWLDCCFSGAFPPGFTPKGTETVDAIDQLASSGRGCAVMTASTKVQYAFEKEASVFTEAIMAGLRTGAADLNEDGLVDAGELYSYVYDWVRQHAPGQTPTRNDMLAGDIYIAHNQNVLRLPLELPQEIRQLLRSSDQRYRQLGIQELTVLAETGDEIARAALAVLGEEPVTTAPTQVSRPPAVVVDLPPKVSESLRTGAPPAPQFEFLLASKIRTKGLVLRKKADITCVTFSPAESQLICVGAGTTVGFVTSHDGMHLDLHLATGGQQVRAVTYSPNGAWLAAATADGVHVWDPNGSTLLLGKAMPGARSVAYSPDNTILASGSQGRIQLRAPSTGKVVGDMLTGHEDQVRGLDFSPDGTLLASASFDHTVRLWDLRLRKPAAAPLRGHEAAVWSVAFSPDGRLLASSGADKTVRLWDIPSRIEIRTLKGHTRGVPAVAFSPDGRALVSAGRDGTVRVWDPFSGELVMELIGHTGQVLSLAFNVDGQRLATAGENGDLMIWKRTR